MTATTHSQTNALLDYPAPRATGCPFDPAPALLDKLVHDRLIRVRLSDGTTPWLVTRFDDQRSLLADRRVSADVTRPGYPVPGHGDRGDSMISFILMDDPEHNRLRRMVTAPFTVRRMKQMRPTVQRIVDDQIDLLLAGPNPADLVEGFALPVPSLVICELLGVPYEDHAFFQQNSNQIVRVSSDPSVPRSALARLFGYLDDLVGRMLDDPGDGVLSGLAERVKAGDLTRAEAAQTGVLLLVAGHETTANMIALSTLALFEHPDQLAIVRGSDDPTLINSAVEELLRYLSITQLGRRRVAAEDIEFAGRVIKAGEGIIFPNEIANRDPDAFAEPDRLDLTRDARTHLAFGFGAHQCLGQPLARLELEVALTALNRRIPTLRPAVPLDKINFKHDNEVYGVYELPVTW